jgi:hypothetical protein
MQPIVASNGLVRPCCMPENLVVSTKGDHEHQGVRGNLVVRICRTCHARHFEFSVEPGRAFTKM